jgi:diguanylate cyclase (GGDEF)-like protein
MSYNQNVCEECSSVMSGGENGLFAREEQILQEAEAAFARPGATASELLAAGRALAGHYRRLLNSVRRLFPISGIERAEAEQSQALLQALLDHSDQGVFTVNRKLLVGRVCSAKCAEIFGQCIAGLHLCDLCRHLPPTARRALLARIPRILAHADSQAQRALIGQLPAETEINGRYFRLTYRVIPTSPELGEQLLAVVLTDATGYRQAEQEIHYLSYHDPLTGLYNRAYVEKWVQRLDLERHLPLSLIIGDLDGLKLVNDLFGHKTGDALLVSMAEVLKSSLRRSDMVARWGGDEYLVVLPSTDAAACARLCIRIASTLVNQERHVLSPRASLGHSTMTSAADSFGAAFARADAMMYTQKGEAGKRHKRENPAQFSRHDSAGRGRSLPEPDPILRKSLGA